MEKSTSLTPINIISASLPPFKKEAKPETHEDFICLCNALHPVLHACRLFGLFPLRWVHEGGECIFKASYWWLAYSVGVVFLHTFQLVHSSDILNISSDQALPELLNTINDTMYGIFVIILTILNVMRYPRFVKTLNKLTPICKEAGLLCQSALKVFKTTQYGFILILMIQFVIEYGVLGWLHFSESFATNFSINTFINRGIQSVPFFFYLLFFCICSLFMGILGCFEKLIISALNFTPVHPLKEIDETNNQRDFIGLIKYQVCKQDHKCFGKMLKITQSELIEYLRCVHEEISLAIYDINTCLNPQFLFHMVVELTVLIIHWYEVIVYTSYDFPTPYRSAINFLNWVFVLLHSMGLFLFLRIAQHLKNMVHGLSNFLLEYSTRISDPDEHQQVRIFIEKLKQHRPLTASGVFNIDLGIAGPISANILTYVLVALQFDVPKK